MTRLVFMGTPEFAVPSLINLGDTRGLDIVGVVTQPDRPSGRGQHIIPSPVKQAALCRGLTVLQPESLREAQAVERLRALRADVIVVAAFGQILRQPILDLAPFGCINVHASLLPRWRGAAPIQYAIRAGDAESGVTIMKIDAGLDTGPLLAQRRLSLAPDETGVTLHDRLARLGAEMLPEVLTAYLKGEITPQPQPQEGITLAPTLSKDEGHIDWTRSAVDVDRLVRAFTLWPGTFTILAEAPIKIHKGEPLPEDDAHTPAGTLVTCRDGLAVQTGSGLYRIDELQPAGRPRMSAQSYRIGHPDVLGQRLT